jgi:hypothetical protein
MADRYDAKIVVSGHGKLNSEAIAVGEGARAQKIVSSAGAALEDRGMKDVRSKLDALLGLCETASCRRVRLLEYFGEASAPCGNCDTCLEPPETFDATTAAQKALSAIYRTGQRFGAVHLIDVLRGKAGEVIVASVLWIEIVSGLPAVLASAGFDQPVDGVIGVVADRLDLLAVVEDRKQCSVFDAGDVSRRVVGVAQVLHDCWIGEEL